MSTSEEEHPSAAGAWWANLLSPTSVFACSACLTQVEWVDSDATTNDTNVLRQDDVKAIEQHHPSDSCVRDGNVLNNSLIDEDSNQSSDHTAEDNVHDNITLDITTESYDEQLRRSPSPINNHTVVTPSSGHGDYSSTIGEFGSCASETSDGDENIGECPICLHSMSNADYLYPMQCAGKNCTYNFCLQCMSSLVKASKDSYQMASDGSLHVKVHLNCPNCRASIKGVVEDVIRRRQDFLAEQVDEDDESSYDSRLIIRASTSIQEEMESEEFLENEASIPRIKNRARAPTYIRHKRRNDLMKELNSIPAPSLVRDQVMATHSHAELTADVPTDRTLKDPLQPMFSSTISHPFYSSTMIAPIDTEMKGVPRRHSKSFEVDRRSPSSVIDEAFWTGEERHESSSNAQNGDIHRAQKTNHCDILTTGGEDDFLAGLDLYWCCSSNDANAGNIIDISGSVPKKSQGCGGYIDYIGTYHQCTANIQNRYALEPCQGCVFRRGIKDGYDDNIVHHEELYYDSDCGQQFAVGTWASAAINYADNASPSLLDASASTHSSSNTESLLRQRRDRQHSRSKSDSIPSLTTPRRKHSRSNSDATPTLDDTDRDQVMAQNWESPLRTNSTPSSPTRSIRGVQHIDEAAHAEQQAYMYDYFLQEESPIRTGVCSTMKAEIGNYVQDALNSRWRLDWHHVAHKGNSSLLRRHPKACEVWIERGYCRNRNEMVEPKLMWRELTQPGLKEGMLTESTLNPYRASLFALRKIVPVVDGDDWQRMSFDGKKPCNTNAWKPMVKPNCLIAVRSSLGQDYLFEASCPEERDRIIHLWKMATARLVSHAVAGNIDMMMQEFFNEAAIRGGLYASMLTTSDGRAY